MSPKTTTAITIKTATTATTTNNRVPATATTKMLITANPLTTANLLPKATSTTSSGKGKVTNAIDSKATKTAPKLTATTTPIATTSTPTPSSIPTSTKIDPYSILSFAVSSSPSSSVSMARMSTMKEGIMSYHNVIAVLALLFLFCGLASVDGLKCHMCGQYNEGVGSITPCLNYSAQYAHLYLKECSKASEKFCVKYVSELSTVRDCATECAEKEVWETQTYCCNTDGCNGAGNLEASVAVILLPIFYFIYKAFKYMLHLQH